MSFKATFFVLITFLMLSCSDSEPQKLIKSYSDDFNATSLATHSTRQYSVYANYEDGSSQEISETLLWFSSNLALASVENGLVQVMSEIGSVEISYKTKESLRDGTALHENSITLDVKDLVVISVSLSVEDETLYVSQEMSLEAEALYDDGSKGIVSSSCEWNSSNPSVISIDENGTLHGVAEGNATIGALCIDRYRDTNVSATPLLLEVKASTYESLEIILLTNEFNLDQNMSLELRATTEENTTVLIEMSDVQWSSEDETVVVIDENARATAKLKGKSKITATLKADSSINAEVTLYVIEDEYMRLFKDNKEFAFPYSIAVQEDELNEVVLDEFSITAVGKDFTIEELRVTDVYGNLVESSIGRIENLLNNETITQDTKRTFQLVRHPAAKELLFHFKVKEIFGAYFDAAYKEND